MPGDGFDIKIVIKKFITGLLLIAIPEILLYSINFMETQEFPPEYLWLVPFIVAFLHAGLNTIKHWND